MKTVVYYDILNYHESNLATLNSCFTVVTLHDPTEATPMLLDGAEGIFAPLGYFCGAELMDMGPALKVVASNTTGDAHIDKEAADKRYISIVTLKNEKDFLDTITPTAELALGLIIALTRNVLPAVRSVVNDAHWQRWPFGGNRMLSRMTLGVAGMGRLGKRVASYGAALGMQVCWYDPYKKQEDFPEYQHCVSLLDMVGKVDAVTVHIPAEPDTTHLFNAEVFANFRHGSYFINTSRGELNDEHALLLALEEGRLAGAALDVLADEFRPGFEQTLTRHPLHLYATTHDNLILTPHIGGSTEDAWQQTQAQTILRMREVLGCA